LDSYTAGEETRTVAQDLQIIGSACCGSLAKTRCFDTMPPPAPGTSAGGTMCKVDADFDGTVNLGDLGLGSPGSTCSSTSEYLQEVVMFNPWADVTCDAIMLDSYTAGEETRTVAQDLQIIGSACCGSLAKTRCFDTMCKVDADFTDTATAGTIAVEGEGNITLTCGGEYGIASQALDVWRQATGNPALMWSDATCADMTTDLTAHFNTEFMHHLYLKGTIKGTMREFVQTYSATCCGSLAKPRDPCASGKPNDLPTAKCSRDAALRAYREAGGPEEEDDGKCSWALSKFVYDYGVTNGCRYLHVPHYLCAKLGKW